MIHPEYVNKNFVHKKTINQRKYSYIHFHKDYELYYLINGTTTYLVGDQFFHLQRGNFVIIPPFVPHNTDSLSCHNVERYVISFPSYFFNYAPFALDELCKMVAISVPPTQSKLFLEMMQRIELELQVNDEIHHHLVNTYIQQIILLLYRYGYQYTNPPTPLESLIKGITEYINENYTSPLSLCSIASQFGISKSYLSQIYKDITGIGLNEYINYVRIEKASKLLSETNLTITEISFSCGFNDSNYFSTKFKKLKGISPLQYAKNQKAIKK